MTGHRRYSRDMPIGGMEVPCKLHFLGVKSKLKKIKILFAKTKGFSVETTTAQIDDSAQCSSSIVKAEKVLLVLMMP